MILYSYATNPTIKVLRYSNLLMPAEFYGSCEALSLFSVTGVPVPAPSLAVGSAAGSWSPPPSSSSSSSN